MRSVHLIAGAAAFAALAVPAAAKPLPTEQFKASAAIAVDPARAYLLVRSPGMDLKLLRVPTDSERVAYKAERAEALAKAKVKYDKALKSYEEGLKDAEEDRLRGIRPPDKPVEPTEDNFAFRAIESDNFVTIWAGRVFDKGGRGQCTSLPSRQEPIAFTARFWRVRTAPRRAHVFAWAASSSTPPRG